MKPVVSDQSQPVRHNYCFGCGPDNSEGMQLEFEFDEAAGKVTCDLSLGDRYTGPPAYCHGGIIATLLDEVMAKLNKLRGVTAVTSEMTVKYLRPVPLQTHLRVEAREVRIEGRRRFREAELSRSDGEVLARGQGIFVTVDPERIFARSG